MDMFGNCWDVLAAKAAPVAFDEAQPSDTNVALSGDCTQDFVDSFVAKQVSDLVANMAARIADPDGGTSGEDALPTGAGLQSTELKLTLATSQADA